MHRVAHPSALTAALNLPIQEPSGWSESWPSMPAAHGQHPMPAHGMGPQPGTVAVAYGEHRDGAPGELSDPRAPSNLWLIHIVSYEAPGCRTVWSR